MTIELKVNGVVVYSDQGTPPIPGPVFPPQPTLPPAPVGVIPSYSLGNIAWDMHETQLWPIPPLISYHEDGVSISFVADAIKYPQGVLLQLVDEVTGARGKQVVVSEKPHDFTPVSKLAEMPAAASTGGPMYLRFGPAQPRLFFGVDLGSLDVPLTPGRTYYINFRGTNDKQVSAQFVVYSRKD